MKPGISAGGGTYAVGWSTVAIGLGQMLMDSADVLAAPDATCTTLLRPLLTSPGLYIVLTGLGVNTGRRAYANHTKAMQEKQDEIAANQKDVVKAAMREILAEKEPKS